MKISKNELTSLLKQAFQGCGSSAGVYETAATTVVWCKTHGFDISSALTAEKMAGFQAHTKSNVKILVDSQDELSVDFGGDSFIVSGVLMAELVYAKSIAAGLCLGKFIDCPDRKLVSKSVADFGQRGVHCTAYWRDNEDPNLINVTRTVDGNWCPEYARYLSAEPSDKRVVELDQSSLYLVCADTSAAMDEYLLSECDEIIGKPFQYWLSEGIKANERSSLMDGIDITPELWDLLGGYRDKVLVESTDESRKGAGA